MNIREAIVLAGGLGTRLQDTLPGIPKCMAPIHGLPFIDYLVQYLQSEGITNFVFAVGYKADMLIDHLQTNPIHSAFTYSMEQKALGTGGAIRQALPHCSGDNILVVNGDTLYKAGFEKASNLHESAAALCTIILKPMHETSRYGSVMIDDTNTVYGFGEKLKTGQGLINGGMYLLDRNAFLAMNWPAQFSFEKDFLQAYAGNKKIMGSVDDGYFIDIGIAEDYERAKMELVR